MLKQKSLLFRAGAVITDVVATCVAIWLTNLYVYNLTDKQFPPTYLMLLVVSSLILVVLTLNWTSLYESLRLKTYFEIVLSLVQATALILVVLTALFTFAKSGTVGLLQDTYPREDPYRINLAIVVFSILLTTLLAAEKLSAKFILSQLRIRKKNLRRMLIVGTGERAQRLDSVMDFHKYWGFHVVGFVRLAETPDPKEEAVEPSRILGNVRDIAEIMDTHVIDEVIFALTLAEAKHLEAAIQKCEEVGITFHLVADFLDTTISKVEFDSIGQIPLLTFSSAPQNLAATMAKRVFDIAVSGGVLLLTSWVQIGAAVLIKLTSRGPVFFRQKRVGLNGRVFTLLKFRSMVSGAEKMQAQLMDQNVMSGPVFKIQKDPRITKVGKFLRKFSIDELPQLWNIFLGQMSIVGPRPLPTYEVEKFVRWQRRRLSMKPGLTCIWQIEGRSKITDFDDWMKLDLQYIDNWSFGLDLRIFFKTIPAVLFAHGAH
jgi:exopolysaccharide biosynthesis polyprenyl glycosylphosphotransferase